MKTNRVFNNFFSSILSQIVTLAFAIVIPRLILVNLGSEANGLLSTIDQILVYVGLLEAGIGVASLQSLYGAFGKNDTNKVSSIVSATNTLYHRTGTAYFFVVVLLSVVSPFFISSDIENNVITTTFLLCGLPGAINYFFQGKYKILLEADGRKYIITNVNLVVKIASSIIKIILLLNGFGIVALQIGFLCLSIAQMLFYLVYIRQKYRWLNLRAAPDYSALSNSKYVILHNVAGLIFTNTDIVILSVFCGLKTVSVYSLYAMVFSIVSTILSHFESADFIFGQTFNNDRERYLKLHDVYELYNMALTFSLFCVANILIIPFM